MSSPELNNFISQARAAGQTDEQIRQTLTAQGWQSSDISQALGGSPLTPVATSSFPWMIVGPVILLLIVGGLAYGFMASKNNQSQQVNQNNQNQNQNTNPNTAQSNSQNCGTFDPTGGNAVVLGNNRQHFPADFSLPPNAKFMGSFGATAPATITNPEAQSKQYGIYYFCTNQSVDEVREFLKNNNPNWDLDISDIPILKNVIAAEKKADGMTYLLNMQVVDGGGQTVIQIGYSGYK